jgi:hypothetical protein
MFYASDVLPLLPHELRQSGKRGKDVLSRRSILASLTTSPMAPTAMAAERSSADGKLVTLGRQFDALAAQIDHAVEDGSDIASSPI